MDPERPGGVSRLRRAAGGLRTRSVAAQLLLLVVALAATVLVVRQVLHARTDEQIEQNLAQEVEELRALSGGIDPRTGEPFGEDVAALFEVFLSRNVPARDESIYTFVDGELFLTTFGAEPAVLERPEVQEPWTAATAPLRQDLDLGGVELRVLAVPMAGAQGDVLGTFVVAIDPAPSLAVVSRAVRTVLVISITALVVSAILAWALAGRVLRPVRQLTATARGISGGELSERIPVSGHDELAELGATFNDMLDRLESSFRSQREFLDDVAHELRTPITIVRGHLELLSDDPDERAETLALIDDELERMTRYVADLLVVAKAAQPDFLRLELIDLGELVNTLRSKLDGLALRGWVVDEVPAPGSALVHADGDRLVQAMLALLSNAVQHTEEGDRIALGARVDLDAREAHLWVSDSGPGIDEAVRERLFERFSRGAASQQGRPEGTGLGLAIVSAIARAHGGRVELDSVVGIGSTFRIVVPQGIEADELGEEP